ncbi:MAG: hypothetical protein AMJ42_02730, partial [Deltaproteobacteria bacterium DG_8]
EILKVEYGHEIKAKALATICRTRTLFANEVLKNIEQHFGNDVYKAIIHDTVRLKEAAGFGLPIHKYNKKCRGAEDYMELARETVVEEKKLDIVEIPIQLGPQQTKEGVLFRYYDPTAQNVQLAGDFSDWKPVENIMIQQKEKRTWKGTVPLKPGKYQYKFIVDGKWMIDPNNPEMVTSDKGISNSLLKVSKR